MSREVGVRDTVAKARLGYIARSLSQSKAVKHHKDVSLALLCTSPSSVILVSYIGICFCYLFPMLPTSLKWYECRGWRNGSSHAATQCSWRWPELGSLHSLWDAHRFLKHQLLGIQCSCPSCANPLTWGIHKEIKTLKFSNCKSIEEGFTGSYIPVPAFKYSHYLSRLTFEIRGGGWLKFHYHLVSTSCEIKLQIKRWHLPIWQIS